MAISIDLNQYISKIEKENIAEEAKRPTPSLAEIQATAKFLKGWAKGKTIVRAGEGSTFWKAGKFMTKIDYKMAQSLAAEGLADLKGDPRKSGALLRMK